MPSLRPIVRELQRIALARKAARELIAEGTAGTLYHGTTLPAARRIMEKGFETPGERLGPLIDALLKAQGLRKWPVGAVGEPERILARRLSPPTTSQTLGGGVAAAYAGMGGELGRALERTLEAFRHAPPMYRVGQKFPYATSGKPGSAGYYFNAPETPRSQLERFLGRGEELPSNVEHLNSLQQRIYELLRFQSSKISSGDRYRMLKSITGALPEGQPARKMEGFLGPMYSRQTTYGPSLWPGDLAGIEGLATKPSALAGEPAVVVSRPNRPFKGGEAHWLKESLDDLDEAIKHGDAPEFVEHSFRQLIDAIRARWAGFNEVNLIPSELSPTRLISGKDPLRRLAGRFEGLGITGRTRF